MSNYLENGAVLPSGLLGNNPNAMMEGFNKSYKNVALRIGVVMQAYTVSDTDNRSKLTTEYDVLVIEQNEDKGATTIIYKNCMSTDGFGAIADFFERTIRKQKKKTTKGDSVNLKGQNGAIALLLCLDGMSDKAIIIGFLGHPDRKTTIKDEGPRMEWEFNGINVKVEKDGSFLLTFKSATDNDGKVIDSANGTTAIAIEKDGSFQVKNKNATYRMDKTGEVALTAKKDIKLETETNISVKAKGNVTVTTDKEKSEITVIAKTVKVNAKDSVMVEAKEIKLGEKAVEAVILGDTFKTIFDTHTHTGNLGAPTTPPLAPMPPTALSKKVKTE